jgi:transposase InsO family protein
MEGGSIAVRHSLRTVRIQRSALPLVWGVVVRLYVEVFHSPGERQLALDRFIDYYNGRRPHLGIGGLTPRQRLTELMAAA